MNQLLTWRDSPDQYSAISRMNHWLVALVVIAMLAIGLYAADLPEGPLRKELMGWHFAIGIMFYPILVLRILWRLFNVKPQPLSPSAWLRQIARWTHGLLLGSLAVQILSGPLMVWSGGHEIRVFDWFRLASPLPQIDSLHNAMKTIHELNGTALLVLIALHVLAALKHALIDRDGTLRRMLLGP